MKKIIEKLFCKHKWKLEHEREYSYFDDLTNIQITPKRIAYYERLYVCKKCGKMEQIRQ